jgi:catechol 2,3-dioxygenase-like lactoylglutathione lyase family enzyme
MEVPTGVTLEGMCPLFQVYDMATSLAFYRDVLGFEMLRSAPPGDDPDWCWLKRDNVQLMLNTQYERHNRPPVPDPASIGAHRDTSLYLGCRDLDAAYQYLRAHGVDVKPPVVRDFGTKQLSLSDPDGYTLCFQWPANTEAP